jgi:thiamine monophosphate synthase
MFAIGGISEDVAQGIKTGLEGVASITDVAAASVKEYRETAPIVGAESRHAR